MPDQLLVLLRAVVPVFALVGLGFALRRRGLVGAGGVGDLNRLLYWVLLPAQLVTAIAGADLRAAFDARALVAALGAFALGLAAMLLAVRRLPPERQGAFAIGATRANAAYLGLPLVHLLALALGPEQGRPLEAGYHVLLAAMVPAFNVGAVIAFLVPRHGVSWRGLRATVLELPRNPLILACVAGIALSLAWPQRFAGTLPGTVVALAAAGAAPLALLATGAALDPALLRARRGTLLLACALKLVALPGLTLLLGYALGAPPIPLAAAVLLMACPAALASVPMARELGGDDALMAAIVVATTVLAPLTLLGWLMVV